jgi:geranylgeranyl diphosphate synthase type I
LEILIRYRETLVQAMDSLLGGPPSPLLTMCRYHLGLADADGTPTRDGAGKMLRPALCLAMCEALGGDIHQCLPAALSLELTHRTSLVFDDIQDRSPQRNHRPTVWGVWGVDQAINGGLALSCYARLALHGMLERGVSPGTILEVHKLLERTVVDLCRGQYLDLDYRTERPSLEQYLEMVRLKTGVLLGAACEVGAIVAGAQDMRSAARRFGEALGVAFQLRDDILGVWGEDALLGKAPNDVQERKWGLPLVLAAAKDPNQICSLLNSPQDVGASELSRLLDQLTVRSSAEAMARQELHRALDMLQELQAKKEWEDIFKEVAAFVVERVT